MLLLYPLLSAVGALLVLPLLPLFVWRKKYRHRLGQRLGLGLAAQMAALPIKAAGQPTLWIHALSVGEVTSALPLVRGLRQAFPGARLVVSATTTAGGQVARRLLAPWADLVIAGPLDLGPVVPWFVRVIKPDLFVLVETDFWPHWLYCLARSGVAMVLVNGRISGRSFARYHRFALLCRPMFRAFTLLAMQTAADGDKMRALGVAADRVVTLGNLKFDGSRGEAGGQGGQGESDTSAQGQGRAGFGFAAAAPLWICGSTHRGEEAIIFSVFDRLRRHLPALQLLIAPRDIDRADEILALGRHHQLDCRRWTGARDRRGPILILDTIGQLAGCYCLATVVFIGGSLVARGGHNPIEPAAVGVPVLFGPHMEDFAEIAATLVQRGAALEVDSGVALETTLARILTDPGLHQAMGGAALAVVSANQGVVRRHLEAIGAILSSRAPAG